MRGLLTDTLRWLGILHAESATPLSDDQVREALDRAFASAAQLWKALDGALIEDREPTASASWSSMPAGRSFQGS